ncbi:O-antigen ligase family protein [Rubellicoccus peritrichatus]|uniref:O-antigen ligase family protein n=1 Tax=Rubellicoccus peritrichatus TaxID=3080537 RepID=A0AAQ3LCM0_9BACT|nr:O-antigen ligase family protein [Puniceicoccus sp. CR14]WOO42912.1 O-antigen ligase family protein [Puniceicoccus sp. CR14]
MNSGLRRKKSSTISLREKWVAIALIPAIMAPPWFLGGMRWWQQLIFLALAIPPFVLCFVRFRDEQSANRDQKGSESAFRRLFGFPPFWLTLLFLVYISIGALNYSWEYVLLDDGAKWQMQKLSVDQYIHWLPNGVKAVFAKMDAWRVVIVYATGLLLVCSVWLGIERRRTLWFLVGIVSLNAFLVALLTILQDLSGTKLIYWSFKSANPQFAGPFQYRNHGGAYMYLGLASSAACAIYHWKRGSSWERKSNPAVLFLFFSFIIIIGLLFAGSRGGILFGGGIAAVATVLFLGTSFLSGRQGLIALGTVSFTSIVLVWFAKPYLQRAWPELEKRIEQTGDQLSDVGLDGKTALDKRFLATHATIDMWKAKPWFGWGAGSFRWIFPKFQFEYPYLFYVPRSLDRSKKDPNLSPRYQAFYNTHNDWAQFPAEYGMIGCGILLSCLGYWVLRSLRYIVDMNVEIIIVLVGGVALFIHSFLDFLLYNPPVMLCVTILITLGGAQLGMKNRRC